MLSEGEKRYLEAEFEQFLNEDEIKEFAAELKNSKK